VAGAPRRDNARLPSAPRASLVVILGALSAFGPISTDLYLPALPGLARDFDAAPWEVQLTLTTSLAGLALGQLLVGPLSDVLGRRRPLLVGLAAYALASLLCALAPTIPALAVFRFLQGCAGAAGIVIARAVVRDLHSGAAAARLYSLLLLVLGAAPILAPIAGGQLLRVASWRGVFVVLTVTGVVLYAATAALLAETLPRERRRRGGLRDTGRTFRRLARDRVFTGYALAIGGAFGAMFAYISGSPFVLQDVHGVSPQLFGILFAVNAVGLVAAGQANARLVGTFSPRRLFGVGLASMAAGGAALLAVVSVGGLGLAGVLPPLFVVASSFGLVVPNATALALADHPDVAGSASAVLGAFQFLVGAAVAPLVGAAGSRSALPMAATIAVSAAAAIAAGVLARTRR
jgi:DHA1 family bicyclomycin/chloramphenicol resistance-like MFS transporter